MKGVREVRNDIQVRPGPERLTAAAIAWSGAGRPRIVDAMLLRDLARARSGSPIWPPSWTPHGPPDTPELRRRGILASARSIGNRLSVTVRFQGHDHVTLLEAWTPPPSLERLLAALTAAVGQCIEEVGDVEVGDALADDPSAAPHRAHVVGTLDAIEEGYVVVAGLRLALAPGTSVPEFIPIGASVTVTVEDCRDRVVATSVQQQWDALRV